MLTTFFSRTRQLWQRIILSPEFLLVILSLIVSAVFLRMASSPYVEGDSYSYLDFANALTDRRIPDIGIRTPVYPLFIALTTTAYPSLMTTFWAQVVLGALTVALLYRIVMTWTGNRVTAWLSSLALLANYGVINYQQTILTETLALFLFFLYLHLAQLVVRPARAAWVPAAFFLVTLALVFERPSFLGLPFLAGALIIASTFFQERRFAWRDSRVRLALFSMAALAACVLIWSGLQYRQNRYFGFTGVSEINRLGKVLQYGYMDETYPADAPAYLAVLTANYDGRRSSPSPIIKRLAEAGTPLDYAKTKEVNDYVLGRHSRDFLAKSVDVTIANLTAVQPEIYALPDGDAADLANRSVAFFGTIVTWSGIAIIGWLLIGLWRVYYRSSSPATHDALLILGASVYLLLTLSFLSYTDYPRLRMPADPLLISLLIALVVAAVESAFTVIKRFIPNAQPSRA